MTEAEHQILVMCWAKKVMAICSDESSDFFCNGGRAELDLLFHIPNGGGRSKSEGAKFKAMGVKAGVPDLCLPIPRNGYNNLWIEMKVERGTTSEAQDKWHRSIESNGGKVVVAYGWKNAVEAICEYLGGKLPNIDKEMYLMESRLVGKELKRVQ